MKHINGSKIFLTYKVVWANLKDKLRYIGPNHCIFDFSLINTHFKYTKKKLEENFEKSNNDTPYKAYKT